jgi:outer membrane protein assembly factor BamB
MRVTAILVFLAGVSLAADWPGWRGPTGSGTSPERKAPLTWDATKNVRWKEALPGEGASSPVIVGGRIYLTASLERGTKRLVLALDAASGKILWTHTIRDNDPERTSALTGHAAATPAADGERVVAVFGNAGVVCLDRDGKQLWQTSLGTFDSELGLASSPVLHGGRVFLVCDHDGDRFTSFDSFLIALDAGTGKEVWKQKRPDVGRGWATPLLFPVGKERHQLIVSTDNEVRAHDPATGKLLWSVPGLGKWVAPSPIRAGERVIAASGKNGPVLAIEPGKPEGQRTLWQRGTGGPYICSPVAWGDLLYLPHETGFLQCVELATGKDVYRERVGMNRFLTSPLAVADRLYWTDEEGVTHVIKAGPKFEVLARNSLGEEVRASPALVDGVLYLRGEKHLFAIAE